MSALPHPIQYQGSKRQLAARILEYFPNDVQTLYEPFAGSAAVSIAVAACGMAQRFVINDLNQPLAKLLQSMVENPQGTSDVYGSVWADQGEEPAQSVAHFNVVRDKMKLPAASSGVSGIPNYQRQGERPKGRGIYPS